MTQRRLELHKESIICSARYWPHRRSVGLKEHTSSIISTCSMFRHPLLPAARSHPHHCVARRLQPLRLRHRLASNARPNQSPTPERKQSKLLKLLDRWIDRVPSSMRGPFLTIRKSPGSYLVSFAILHELTAIIPLGFLVAGFHYFHWLPPYFSEGKWAIEGVEKIGRWFRRRGWIGEEEKADVEAQTRAGKARLFEEQQSTTSEARKKNNESGGRLLVEVATAYAIVKALVPVRLFVSALWAPWFARQVLARASRIFTKLGKR